MDSRPSRDVLPSAPLSDAEVAELDEFLRAVPEEFEPLDVAMLDGFLAGILLQPDVVQPSAWLPLVFDAEGRDGAWPDDAVAQRVLDLIMRRHNELAAYVLAREPFAPIVFELEDERGQALCGKAAIAALEPWAAGFANALVEFPALRDRLDAEEDGAASLLGILRHLPDDSVDALQEAVPHVPSRGEIDRELPLADLDDAIEALVESVMDVADITRPRRPVERAGPKVGRNDPCPCGSGRKFKHCHGATVH
jgi:uncharacterized protein